jgi:tetratricopeptide (TPR) repeat protein
METGRVALVHYDGLAGVQCVGSGLLIDDSTVLTADHVADGRAHCVEVAGRTHAVASALRSDSPDVDLALLTLTKPVAGFGRLRCARVDQARIGRIDGCSALGFPRWAKTSRRISAQVDGTVPTGEGFESLSGEGLRPRLLTLVGDRNPRMPPIPQGVLTDTNAGAPTSTWGGMSGAVVVSDDLVIGVVCSHNLAAGEASLTVTPLTAIDTLPEPRRGRFWDALGVTDSAALPVLPHASGPQVPHQLPRAASFFTGREDELKWLDERLAEHRRSGRAAPALLAVSGMGGIGKTALAVYWSHRVADLFPDGHLFADLQGFDPEGNRAGPEEVLDGFLRALGFDADRIPVSLDAMAAHFRTVVAGRSLLIILDNAADAAQICPLLPGAPGCLVLVTSRHELGALDPQLPVVRLPELPQANAVELIQQITGADRADAEPAAVDELAHLCGYHPLALRIAASRAALRGAGADGPLSALAAELAQEHDRLEMLRLPAGENMIVRAVLSWSYRDLVTVAPESARLFRLLGLHSGPDLPLAAAASLAGITLARARLAVEGLADASLIEPDAFAVGRCRMHDLLRLYARECAVQDEMAADRGYAVRRCMRWYVCSAIAAGRVIDPVRPRRPDDRPYAPDTLSCPPPTFDNAVQAMGWFESERVNLVKVTAAALDLGADDIAGDLPAAAVSFYLQRNHLADWLTSHKIAFEAASRSRRPAAQLLAAYNLALVLVSVRSFEEAHLWLTRALQIACESRDELAEAKILMLQGSALLGLLRNAEALELFRTATERLRNLGDPVALADALHSLGACLTELGKPAEGLPALREAVELNSAWGLRTDAATSSYYLANALIEVGRFAEAEKHLTSALAIFELDGIGMPQRTAETLGALARALHSLGSRTAADECARRALGLFRLQSDGYGEALMLELLARFAAEEGDEADRQVCLDTALGVLAGLSDPQAVAFAAALRAVPG